MPPVMTPPPRADVEPVTEILHGVSVTAPYRWLEDQDSPRTPAWIEEQTRYARVYLDNISGRDRIRERTREFLDADTYDSLQIAGGRYFFRKQVPDQEQPCIYMREGADGEDQLLIDPIQRGSGKYTAVKPLRVSPDGRITPRRHISYCAFTRSSFRNGPASEQKHFFLHTNREFCHTFGC